MFKRARYLIAFIIIISLLVQPVLASPFPSLEKAIRAGDIYKVYRDKVASDEQSLYSVGLEVYKVESLYDVFSERGGYPTRDQEFQMTMAKDLAMKKAKLGNKLKKKGYQVEKNAKIIGAYLFEIDYVREALAVKLLSKKNELLDVQLFQVLSEYSVGRKIEQDLDIARAELKSNKAQLELKRISAEGKLDMLEEYLGVEVSIDTDRFLERRSLPTAEYYLNHIDARVEVAKCDIINALNTLDIEHYEAGYKVLDSGEEIDKKSLEIDIEKNNLQRKIEEGKIRDEILKAQEDFYIAVKSYDLAHSAEGMAKQKLEDVKVLYDLGKVTKPQLLKAEIGFIEASNNRVMAAMNAKIISKKLLFAASAGPSYEYDYQSQGLE